MSMSTLRRRPSLSSAPAASATPAASLPMPRDSALRTKSSSPT
jgi:hypothetical protein